MTWPSANIPYLDTVVIYHTRNVSPYFHKFKIAVYNGIENRNWGFAESINNCLDWKRRKIENLWLLLLAEWSRMKMLLIARLLNARTYSPSDACIRYVGIEAGLCGDWCVRRKSHWPMPAIRLRNKLCVKGQMMMVVLRHKSTNGIIFRVILLATSGMSSRIHSMRSISLIFKLIFRPFFFFFFIAAAR